MCSVLFVGLRQFQAHLFQDEPDDVMVLTARADESTLIPFFE